MKVLIAISLVLLLFVGVSSAWDSWRVRGPMDRDAIVDHPFSGGLKLHKHGEVGRQGFYKILTTPIVVQHRGAWSVDIGDQRVVVPGAGPKQRSINQITVFDNGPRGSGGAGGSGNGRDYIRVSRGSGLSMLHINQLLLIFSDLTLRVGRRDFDIGQGARVIFLNEDLEVSEVVEVSSTPMKLSGLSSVTDRLPSDEVLQDLNTRFSRNR